MTKIEIIEETANFYNLGNRGVRNINSGSCVYQSDDGTKHCAVGRCIEPDALYHFTDFAEEDLTGVRHLFEDPEGLFFEKNLDDYLKEEYRGHDIDFWADLQEFHDDTICWTDDGLSYAGEQRHERLLARWKDK